MHHIQLIHQYIVLLFSAEYVDLFPHLDEVVVHCRQGVSRSAAIGLSLPYLKPNTNFNFTLGIDTSVYYELEKENFETGTIEEFYLEKNARIHFFKINAWEPEEQKMFCMKYLSDAGVPQFKAYYRGEEILNKIGGGNEETIKNFIHSAVDTAFFRFKEKI